MNAYQKQVASFRQVCIQLRIHLMIEGANFLSLALFASYYRYYLNDNFVFLIAIPAMIILHLLLHIILVKSKDHCNCFGCGIMVLIFMNLFIQFGSIFMFQVGNPNQQIEDEGLQLAFVTQLGLLLIYASFMASILLIGFLAIFSYVPATKWLFSLWLLVLFVLCISLSIYYFIQARDLMICFVVGLFCFMSVYMVVLVLFSAKSISILIQTFLSINNNPQLQPSPCFETLTYICLALIFFIDALSLLCFNFFSFKLEYLKLDSTDYFLYPVGVFYQIGNLLFFAIIASPLLKLLKKLKCAAGQQAPRNLYQALQPQEQFQVNLSKQKFSSVRQIVKNVNCAICLEDFTQKSEVFLHEACVNAFHFSCINEWVDQTRKQCPLCRKPIV